MRFTDFWPKHWTIQHIVEHGLKEVLVNQKLDKGEIMTAIENLNSNIEQLKANLGVLLASKQAASEASIQAGADAVAALNAEVVAAIPVTTVQNPVVNG